MPFAADFRTLKTRRNYKRTSLSSALGYRKDRYLHGSDTGVLCSSARSSIKMKMSVEHCWNDADRGRRECWEKNLFQGHFVRQKSHRTKPVSNPGPCGWRPATDRLKHESSPELYLNIQSVPRSKHTPSRFYETVSQCCIGK